MGKTTAGGEALDLALGLLRAPARRELLAGRQLPDGMTALLEVASGSSSAARAAAAATGAAPAELREAARFFVQQVLFTDDATAYRVLGTGPGATHTRLNQHHRLLQRWLHPDRDGGEAWDSAFSARVNEAWSRVRTPRARRAYDAELASRPSTAAPEPRGGTWLQTVPAPAAAPPAAHRRGLWGPLAVIAAALLCTYLLWLLHQRDLRAQADAFVPQRPAPASVPAGQGEGIAAALGAIELEPSPPDAPPAPGSAPTAFGAFDYFADAAPMGPDEAWAAVAVEARELAEAEPAAADEPGTAEPAAAPATDQPPVAEIAQTAEDTQPPAEDPFLLLQEAEHAVAQVAAYLASDGSHVPPVWNDFPTEASAAATRAGLQRRLDGGSLELQAPRWVMGNDRAALDAGYRAAGAPDLEEGTLRIEMTRREQRWLVTRLHLEPGR